MKKVIIIKKGMKQLTLEEVGINNTYMQINIKHDFYYINSFELKFNLIWFNGFELKTKSKVQSINIIS